LRILWTGGAQKIAIYEYKWLKRLGYEPKLIFLRGGRIIEFEELLRDVDYEIIRTGNLGLLTPLYSWITHLFARERGPESTVDLDLIRKIPQIAKKEEADYLVCHDQFTGLGGYYAKQKLKIPYSVFIHEKLTDYHVPLLGRIWENYERRVLLNANKVFAVTYKVANSIVKRHGIEAEVNYPGMDEVGFTPYSKKENILISVAHWDFGRRPEAYVDLMEEIKGYKLLLVGNWRLKKAKELVVKKVVKKGLTDIVEFIEGVPESKLIKLYQRSKFVMRFGFGEYGPSMAVIEAIQNTVPVIINDELGGSEIIKGSGVGLILNQINAKEIAGFLKEVDNEQQYLKLQENIRRLRDKYCWKKHVEKLIWPLL
jgi:glycosyltransferase involved in cell wall biosynthesis